MSITSYISSSDDLFETKKKKKKGLSTQESPKKYKNVFSDEPTVDPCTFDALPEDRIQTKASVSHKRHSFNVPPLDSLSEGNHENFSKNWKSDLSTSDASDDQRKHSKKRKKMDDSEIFTPERSSKKNKRESLTDNSFTFTESEENKMATYLEVSPERHKKHKKKKRKVFDFENISENQESNEKVNRESLSDTSFTEGDSKKNKMNISSQSSPEHYKKKEHVIFDFNNLEGSTPSKKKLKKESLSDTSFTEGDVKKSKIDKFLEESPERHKKKEQDIEGNKKSKKKVKRESLSDTSFTESEKNKDKLSENSLEHHKKHKKKKHLFDSQGSEETEYYCNGNASSDEISERHKEHKKKKTVGKDEAYNSPKKEIFSDVSFESIGSLERSHHKNHKKHKTVIEDLEGESSFIHKKKKKKFYCDDSVLSSDYSIANDLDESKNFSFKEKHKKRQKNGETLDISDGRSIKDKKLKLETGYKASALKRLLKKVDFNIEDRSEPKTSNRRFSVLVAEKNKQLLESSFRPKSPLEKYADVSLEELIEDAEQRYQLTKEEHERLQDLVVVVPWPIHKLHLIETRVAGRPTPLQRKAIEELGVQLKTGIFSGTEDQQIRQNWKYFCKLHDLPSDPKPFLNFATFKQPILIPSPERIKFVQFLAHGLPNRLLCSVYKRFKRLFTQEERKIGRYTSQEDKIIVEYLKKSSTQTPYSDLAKILNRDKLSIERRCKQLDKTIKNEIVEVRWNKDMIEEFMKHFVHVTKVEDVEELKKRKITLDEWKEMSQRMGISVEKLKRAWLCTIYPRIFIDHSVKTGVLKEHLIELLLEYGKTDWRDVNWNEIAEEFDGFTGKKLNKITKEVVTYYVPLDKQHDLGECLRYLKDEVLCRRPLHNGKLKKLKIVDRRSESET